ncbi:diguanylate cyclase [Asaia sp. HN010]|uniref:ligand-binding sensor domain-containing diguanylate cyclase n=1 Tax=Asaia sp. HN010 TaxID=3081233 RepID=UPI003017185F
MEHLTLPNGIDNAYIFNLSQDSQGYIYLSTMRGVYFFSGARFYRLPLDGAFSAGAVVVMTRLMPDGRMLISDGNNVGLATSATSARRSPATLDFNIFSLDHTGKISGIFVDNGNVFLEDRSGLRKCALLTSSLSCADQIVPGTHDVTVYQARDHVFIIPKNASIVRDLAGKVVFSVERPKAFSICPNRGIAPNLCVLLEGRVISTDNLGNIPQSRNDGAFSVADRGERSIFATGSADATVLFDGNRLRSFDGDHWSFLNHELSREQEITFAFVDMDNQLWTAQDLVELDKLIGWGDWENLEPQDIRSVWSVLPLKNGHVVFTSQGIYALSRYGLDKKLGDGNFFFGESDGQGAFWAPVDDATLLRCRYGDLALKCDRRLPVERVTGLAFSRQSGTLWIASDDGLLSLASGTTTPHIEEDARGRPLTAPATAVTLRRDGTPWAVDANILYRKSDDGRWIPVVEHWPNSADFSPLVMTFTSRNDLWIGGIRAHDGLLHLTLDGNHVSKIEQIAASSIGSQIVFSLLWDSGRRLWVGTENGLAGFDGHQWVRVTKDDGLISANINQQGLSEDRDGTIWITTSRGVSHLMHPEHLFLKQNLRPVFVKVMLGEKMLPEKAVPYTRDPLMVTLGSLNTALSSTTYFRYRLEGVDQNWITTTTGEIRYNFVPPGHSRLIVQALNDNRNLVSEPIVLEIRMLRPWWSAWPFVLLYTLSVIALPYTLNKLRFRYLMKRQRRLEELVDERTTEMRVAQSALEQQARQDGLTKLMNRRTAEASVTRLLEKLSRPDDTGVMRSATLALFDVDHFKSINDSFGHAIGDEVLAGIGARLIQAKRQEEIIGRHGGEEFLIVVQGEFAEAQARIASLLAGLSDVPFETKVGPLTIGCSAGVARTRADEAWADALERADQALYRAKLEGRGRIVVSARDQDDEDCPD